LTDAGQSYVADCKRILEDVAEAERAAAGEYRSPRGELDITAPIVFGRLHVLPVVTEFLAAFPEIDVRLSLGDRNVDLDEEHIDLAVRIGELPDSSLFAAGVGTVRRVVCGSPDYLARRGLPITLADLANHDCISFDTLSSPGGWIFGTGEVVKVRSRLVINTAEAAIDAAASSVGLTRVLSYQVAQKVAAGALVIALKDFEPPPAPVSLVYVGGPRLALKLRAFLDFAAPRLKARLIAAAIA
jgi:DNA-binding transcriptional LysR family regulator